MKSVSGHASRVVVASALAGLLVAAVVRMPAPAAAQETRAPQVEEPGFFERVGNWFDRQFSSIGSTFKDAGKTVSEFGKEAGVAAKTTVKGAQDAADVMMRIPGTRVIKGHAKCVTAPNGAPDCVAAAVSICKAKGFEDGSSMDMTTAEICPPQAYLAGRNSGPDCHTETFVSRALCQ